MKKILIADDEKSMLLAMTTAFEEEGFTVYSAEDGLKARSLIEEEQFDLILLDLKLPHLSGEEIFKEIINKDPSTKVIIITAYGSVENAVNMLKAGAYHYLTKPFDVEELKIIAKRALDHLSLERMLKEVKMDTEAHNYYGIIGISRRIRKVVETIESLRDSPASVLITGETGTGKELVAKVIHRTNTIYKWDFVAVNCGAVPENLIESELFGYVKGAFTGAVCNKKGKIELANGGTLFLDEIGDLPLFSQAKLLRVLEEKMVEPLGGTTKRKVDFRLICATNRDLESMVSKGLFRKDLFYRINVIHIEIPPLRERKDDIPFLLSHFIKEKCIELGRDFPEIDPVVMDILTEHNFPGNVRELKNIVEHIMAFGKNRIGIESLPSYLRNKNFIPHTSESSRKGKSLKEIVEECERKTVWNAYIRAGKKVTDASRMLGISRKTFWKKAKKYGISLIKEDKEVYDL